MSDLNSPEKSRSEPSLADSQPRSWSDVTLIEDITQESSSRHLAAHCLEEDLESSSESVAEQPSPTEPPPKPPPVQIPAQAVCVVKRFRARSRSRGPGLPIASAPDTTQLCPAPCDTDKPRLLPLSRETDTALVGELHQKAQNAVGPSARKSACTPDQLQSQNAPAAEQGRISAYSSAASYWLFTEVSQEPQPVCRAELTTSQIPADDTEALLVEKFANQGTKERHAERLRPPPPSLPLARPWCPWALALKGLESVDDFAYAFPEIRSLEALLSGLSDSDLSDMGSTDQFHGVQAARIRKALRFAHDLCQQPTEPTQQISQPPSLPAAILPQVENLPPKLSQEAAQELIDDFKTNYPGELLDEDTMPSIRLLSLVQHSLKP
ncbi:unnamed protein product, partial [Symbiodinium microadriaticum]